jgi:hypothetical protein
MNDGLQDEVLFTDFPKELQLIIAQMCRPERKYHANAPLQRLALTSKDTRIFLFAAEMQVYKDNATEEGILTQIAGERIFDMAKFLQDGNSTKFKLNIVQYTDYDERTMPDHKLSLDWKIKPIFFIGIKLCSKSRYSAHEDGYHVLSYDIDECDIIRNCGDDTLAELIATTSDYTVTLLFAKCNRGYGISAPTMPPYPPSGRRLIIKAIPL